MSVTADKPAVPDIEETARKRQRQASTLMRQSYVGLSDRDPYVKRFETLKSIRTPMEPVWKQIRDYILPACGRYLNDDSSDPDNEQYTVCQSSILDSTPTKMIMTAADGLHGGLTNQSEQWFSLYIGNYQNYQDDVSAEAKEWITNAQNCTRDTLASSNFYTAIYSIYLEALAFGSAAMLVMSDYRSRARYYPKTIGTYWLSQDSTRRIDAMYTRSTLRAVDIVKDYGENNCPERVIEAVKRGLGDKKFSVIQCIQPWDYFGRNPPHPDFTFEDVRYVEGGDRDEKILYRGGYRTKPFVAIRWSDSGDYVYCRSCPGIDALPDIKQLQSMTLDYNMATKWMSDPAWAMTSNNDISSIVPGGIYRVDGDPRSNMLVPLVPPEFNIQANSAAADALRERISAMLYNREFLMVQNRSRQITATEVNELRQEKFTVLGPVTARIGDNVLISTLDRTLEILMLELVVLPPAPEEIQGQDIKPYFTGQLAKAQRQSGMVADTMQFLQIVGTTAQLQPQVLNSVDFDKLLRNLEEVDLAPPGVIVSRQKVEEINAAQQQQMAQQQQQAEMAQAASMAQSLGSTSVAPDTALGQMVGNGEEGAV